MYFTLIIFTVQSLTTLRRSDTDSVKDPLFRFFEREVRKKKF